MKHLSTAISRAAAGLALALALAGCGPVSSGPESPGQPPPGGAAGGGAAGGGAAGGGAAGGGPGQPRAARVAWAPGFGPISKTSPPGHRWYEQVQQRDCAGLLEQVRSDTGEASEQDKHLYGGLARACTGRWAEAKADLARIDPDTLIDP